VHWAHVYMWAQGAATIAALPVSSGPQSAKRTADAHTRQLVSAAQQSTLSQTSWQKVSKQCSRGPPALGLLNGLCLSC